MQHTKSQARTKNQAVVFATHELAKSRKARAKNQAVVFAAYDRAQTHEHTIFDRLSKNRKEEEEEEEENEQH